MGSWHIQKNNQHTCARLAFDFHGLSTNAVPIDLCESFSSRRGQKERRKEPWRSQTKTYLPSLRCRDPGIPRRRCIGPVKVSKISLDKHPGMVDRVTCRNHHGCTPRKSAEKNAFQRSAIGGPVDHLMLGFCRARS